MKLVSPKPFAKKPTRFEHVANVGDGLVNVFKVCWSNSSGECWYVTI